VSWREMLFHFWPVIILSWFKGPLGPVVISSTFKFERFVSENFLHPVFISLRHSFPCRDKLLCAIRFVDMDERGQHSRQHPCLWNAGNA